MTHHQNAYFKRNFILGVINGTLVNFGMAFMDPFTVLPVFILRLGGSELIVGATSAIAGVGWFLPQVFISRLAESRRHLLGIYRGTTLLRIAAWIGVSLCVCLLDPENLNLYLSAFIFFFLLAHLGAGLSAVPFLEITSKTIPVTSRGAFFGTRRFLGGVLGIFAGVMVSVILNSEHSGRWMGAGIYDWIERLSARMGLVGHDFPLNYGLLFCIGGALVSAAMIFYSFVGEPPAPQIKKPEPLSTHLLSGFRLLRDDRNYQLFYVVRMCWQLTAMAFPFYSGYAYTSLHYSETTVGIFVSIWVGSGVTSNYLWGWLMDRRGNKVVLIITAALSLFPPLTVLFLEHVHNGSISLSPAEVFIAIASTFFINGFIRSGRVISNITYLLEIAPLEKRALYTGFMNSFTFPLMLSPILGGIILHFFSVSVLFSISLIFGLLNLMLSFRLREPRQDIPDKPGR